MAATAIGNPAGAVAVFDFGAPQILTGIARETISGGVFVIGSTAADVVSSGTNSFAAGDILFVKDASGAQVNGIALYTAGSNQAIAVATNGVFICATNGTVTAGLVQQVDGNNAVADIGSSSVSVAMGASKAIGRAITAAGSNSYALVKLNL